MAFEQKPVYDIADLLEIMALLRGENGCPWDREQDHQSIRKNFLEETYEVLEAIDNADSELLREELGDVLLQVVFHSRIEEEAGRFGFSDVCDGICKKLIERHPHIFGNTQVDDSAQVLANWEQIKQKSKGQTTAAQTLQSVPVTFPALMRSEKVQKRAAKAGFDYPDTDGAMLDLESELAELREAIAQGDHAHIVEELGDLLFSVVNVARFLKCDPEQALTDSCNKFIRRFTRTEQLALQAQLDFKTASFSELDKLWKTAKQQDA